LRIYGLKDEPRAGWVLRGIRDPESVADHSWGSALLCHLYAAEAGVDPSKSIAIALVHDVAEAITGDLPRRVDPGPELPSPAEKAKLERAAIEELFGGDGPWGQETRQLWEEYEASQSPEAQLARDMNLVDMCLQALLYEREGRYDPARLRDNFPRFDGLDEFFATARPRFATAVGKRLFAEIEERYRALRR